MEKIMKKTMKKVGWCTLSSALLLGGCAVGPDYVRPDISMPAGWGERADTSLTDLSQWWTLFGDPTLERLVERALQANHDLRIARARVKEARALVGVAKGALLPDLDASGSYRRFRTSENVPSITGPGRVRNIYSSDLDSAWEIDLFGGRRREVESESAEHEASVELERAVRVSLLGDVGASYVEVRGNQKLMRVFREDVDAARKTLDLVRRRREAGLAAELDVARVETELGTVESRVPPIEAAVWQGIHRLGVLLGQEPRALAEEISPEGPIPVAPPEVVVGLPSELLSRRPDLRAAERRLAASTARVGVATADLYPKFSLTAAFGLESLVVGDFSSAASRAWTLGPFVRWPLFSGGRLRARIRAVDARVEEALASYERAVLIALEEVEDALVAYLREWDRHKSLEGAVAEGRRAVEFASNLYENGLVNLLDVLDARRTLYEAEAELARSDTAVSLNLVFLYKALGGGWRPDGHLHSTP